jgi:hypothetical protein
MVLNEETFISEQLRTLYPFCSGISVLTQYDRDYYGSRVAPDSTVRRVLEHPDPEGKLSLVLRRWRNQAPALNHEMIALTSRPERGTRAVAVDPGEIRAFHRPPDYFMIVDGDDFHDVDTLDRVFAYLARERPRAMRMQFLNYLWNWNRRVPRELAPTSSFVFVRPDVRFQQHRIVSWSEFRLSGFRSNVMPQHWDQFAPRYWHRWLPLLERLGVPDLVSRAHGFITCPEEVGVVHHGEFIGGWDRIWAKASKSGHRSMNDPRLADYLEGTPTVFVPTAELPRNIREGEWPAGYFEEGA